jgi:hypothetical protein
MRFVTKLAYDFPVDVYDERSTIVDGSSAIQNSVKIRRKVNLKFGGKRAHAVVFGTKKSLNTNCQHFQYT